MNDISESRTEKTVQRYNRPRQVRMSTEESLELIGMEFRRGKSQGRKRSSSTVVLV